MNLEIRCRRVLLVRSRGGKNFPDKNIIRGVGFHLFPDPLPIYLGTLSTKKLAVDH